jgi:hypothetical protein
MQTRAVPYGIFDTEHGRLSRFPLLVVQPIICRYHVKLLNPNLAHLKFFRESSFLFKDKKQENIQLFPKKH